MAQKSDIWLLTTESLLREPNSQILNILFFHIFINIPQCHFVRLRQITEQMGDIPLIFYRDFQIVLLNSEVDDLPYEEAVVS